MVARTVCCSTRDETERKKKKQLSDPMTFKRLQIRPPSSSYTHETREQSTLQKLRIFNWQQVKEHIDHPFRSVRNNQTQISNPQFIFDSLSNLFFYLRLCRQKIQWCITKNLKCCRAKKNSLYLALRCFKRLAQSKIVDN